MKTFKPQANLATDSYKLGHMVQYPKGTELVYSNFTPRSDHHSPIPKHLMNGQIVVYGTQALFNELVALWDETFFNQDKETLIYSMATFVEPFAKDFQVGLQNFNDLHDLGYLPLEVKSIEEGTIVPIKTPIITIKNTIPEFYWLVNFIETYLSQQAWKMPTVATIAYAYRKLLTNYAMDTGASLDFVDWQAHDFSARGLSGAYDNAMVGSAHLTSFKGTDSLLGVQFLNHFYEGKSTFIGGSVPATEHSVMAMNGELDELETYHRLITEVYPDGIVSIVSDTWDFWKVLTEYTVTLKDTILNRNGKVVFRPDSGDPVEIICGTAVPVDSLSNYHIETALRKHHKTDDIARSTVITSNKTYYTVFTDRNEYSWQHKITQITNPTPEMKGAVEVLWEIFGGTTNSLDFKTLDQHVGLIYGDSITLQRAEQILERLKFKGFASDNVVLGVGSYSYQYLTRDTFGFAMKATAGIVNNEFREIFKNPKTDNGIKKSARGYMKVIQSEDGTIQTLDQQPNNEGGLLQTIFKNGTFSNITTIKCIRAKLNENQNF